MMTTVAEFCYFFWGGGVLSGETAPQKTSVATKHDISSVTAPMSTRRRRNLPPIRTSHRTPPNLPRSRDSGAFRAVLALRSLKGTLPHVRLQHGEGLQGREVSSGAVPQGGRRVGVQVRSRRRHARGGARCGRPVRTNGIVNRVC